jgi:hypothetical protein
VDTSDLQKRLKSLVGEEIPPRTLWRWVKQGLVAPPDRVPRGKGKGRGRHVEWSERTAGDIAVLLAVRKIRRAKAFRIKTEWSFSSGALLEAISLAYADILPVKHGSDTAYVEDSFFGDEDMMTSRGATTDVFGFKHVWKGITQGEGADIRLADLDSRGCKQAFLLPSPFIPLQGEPRVSPDDAVHALAIAAAVIAFEKEKKGWPRRPARVIFSWYLEFPLIGLSRYTHKGDWDSNDYDHKHDYDMVCVRDDVLIEEANSDELIICVDAHVVLEMCAGAIRAYLPWFMARPGYQSGQSGRRYPGLPLFPSYLRSKPTRPKERKSFRIRRRGRRAISDRSPPRDGIRRRVKRKSGHFRPWKWRRAKRPAGTSAPSALVDINSVRPRSYLN